jgi:hypothetical protein
MGSIPAKVCARVAAGLKKFQPILEDAKKRDVNESDTVTIVADILSDLFGYDKYSEVTSEFAIRSTYCDLAVKLEGKLTVLVEVKAIGSELKDPQIKQAVDYAANQGCDWTVLTNGITWQVYQVTFGKPIDTMMVLELDLLALNPRKGDDVDLLANLSREAWSKSNLEELAIQKQALSRFTIAAVLLSEPIRLLVRREIRRISADVKVDIDDILRVLTQEVLKRDVIEGDKAEGAKKLVSKAAKKALRVTEKAEDAPMPPAAPTPPPS